MSETVVGASSTGEEGVLYGADGRPITGGVQREQQDLEPLVRFAREQPITTVMLEVVVFRQQPFRWRTAAAVALGFSGVAALLVRNDSQPFPQLARFFEGTEPTGAGERKRNQRIGRTVSNQCRLQSRLLS